MGDIAELVRKDISQNGTYDVPSFVPPEEIPSPDILLSPREENFSRNPNKISFETDFTETEPENYSDMVRVSDER